MKYVILDLEAICWEQWDKSQNETIELKCCFETPWVEYSRKVREISFALCFYSPVDSTYGMSYIFYYSTLINFNPSSKQR